MSCLHQVQPQRGTGTSLPSAHLVSFFTFIWYAKDALTDVVGYGMTPGRDTSFRYDHITHIIHNSFTQKNYIHFILVIIFAP